MARIGSRSAAAILFWTALRIHLLGVGQQGKGSGNGNRGHDEGRSVNERCGELECPGGNSTD
jgi:hypothetical protein